MFSLFSSFWDEETAAHEDLISTSGEGSSKSPRHENDNPIISYTPRVHLIGPFADSASSQPATEWVLRRIYDGGRMQCASKPYHRPWKYRTWLVFALCQQDRQLQHRYWRGIAGQQ